MNPSSSIDEAELFLEAGIDPSKADVYRSRLVKGFKPVRLSRIATLGDGIARISDEKSEELIKIYDKGSFIASKFVPASGAASRMFRTQYEGLESGETSPDLEEFFQKITKYPFAKELLESAGISSVSGLTSHDRKGLLIHLLTDKGLNLGSLPKGMVPFHRYDEEVRTAFEEHFHEAVEYASKEGRTNLHFTIPPDQKSAVIDHLSSIQERLSELYGISFNVSTSLQSNATNTPAIYRDDQEWVLEDEKLVLRPAGHGALLENLNAVEGDVIFVKNIDNVVPDSHRALTVKFKKILGGKLLELRDSIFGFLNQLDRGTLDRNSCIQFLRDEICIEVETPTDQELREILNRPIRVCGMVRNEGEPGGGPFFVEDESGVSLQIVEMAQVDMTESSQQEILASSSHFNPVDLAVSIKNYKGELFDLKEFRKDEAGMRVEKTFEGRNIYGLELPGLWNGGMYYWNTVFIEVPIETFNPVKSVADLLRPAHQ